MGLTDGFDDGGDLFLQIPDEGGSVESGKSLSGRSAQVLAHIHARY